MKKHLALCSLPVLILSYQNCAPFASGSDAPLTSSSTTSSSTPPDLQAESIGILDAKCATCHAGGQSQGGVSNIDQPSQLIAQGLITPGQGSSGTLVAAMANQSMPLSGTKVTADELTIIENWIEGMNANGTTGLQPSFASIQQQILPQCTSCHSPQGQRPQTDFTSYQSLMASGTVTAGNAQASSFYEEPANGNMPLYQASLSSAQLETIRQWIAAGAANN